MRILPVILFFIFFQPLYVYAETNIAVVDVHRLLTESKAGKSIQAQRKVSRDSFLSEISNEEKKLRDEEEVLISQQKTLSREEYEKKRQTYEKDLLKMRRTTQEHKQKIEEASKVAMDILRNEIYLAVQSIADERNYDLVISSKNVIAGANSLDITNETMKKMDGKISEIKMDMPSTK